MENDEDSQKALLKKKKKAEEARKKTQRRFEALLTVGSGSEEISSAKSPTERPKKKRTRTAESAKIKNRLSPNSRRRSKSEENLLQPENDTEIPSSQFQKPPTYRSKQTDTSYKEKGNTNQKRRKQKPKVQITGDQEKTALTGVENEGYEQTSFIEDKKVHEDNTLNDVTELEQDSSKSTKKKQRRKKKKVSSSQRIYNALEKKRHDDGLLLCILIHKTDQLRPDPRLQHPVIRVHLVNMETGQYLKKTDNSRNVTSLFENQNENVDYILPVMTQPYDIKRRRSFTPMWNESLIYNEIYSYVLQREQDDPPTILFFELMDFVLMNQNKREISRTDKGWYKFAWAFLKVVGPSGAPNTEKQARLQFYQPVTRMRLQAEETGGIEIYKWWKFGRRQPYQSTLYVTVKGVLPPDELNPTTRSMFPLQQERGRHSLDELMNTTETIKPASEHNIEAPLWTKLPNQVNRIPNQLHTSVPTGRKGCSALCFSPDGRYLACGCSTNDGYPIKIFQFPEGQKLVCSFSNHFGIIYDLCWSLNGKELLSASADSTARCWDTKRFTSTCIKLFPHPTFVYCAKYHPGQSNLVLTGCYDKMIRVWNKMSESQHGILLRELAGHTGFINTLSFLENGTYMFSGDSNGLILQWHCEVTGKKRMSTVSASVERWKVAKLIEFPDLKNTTINTLIVHPSQMKVLVHSRDSLLRMLDLRSYGILKTYTGGLNYKEHIHAEFSTCGSFIFCGTESGNINVWNTETGDKLYTYRDLGYVKPVTDITFHPQDNFIAFGCYGEGGHPIYIYSYDPKVHLEPFQGISDGTVNEKSSRLAETQKSLNEATELFQSFRGTSSLKEDTIRMQKVKEKLDSVTLQDPRTKVTFNESTSSNRRQSLNIPSLKQPATLRSPKLRSPDLRSPALHSPRVTSPAPQTMLSTWGSDFTYTMQPNEETKLSVSSPHAQQYFGASARFTAGSPLAYHRKGSIDMYLDKPMTQSELEPSPARPVFKFNENKDSAGVSNEENGGKTVVAIYEYKPNRADELHIYPNDKIKVLYEDGRDWWMGQLEDGQQGYFPSSYVLNPDEEQTLNEFPIPPKSNSHSAVIDKHGDIKFLTDVVSNDTLQTKRKKKKRTERKDSEADSKC